MPDTKLPPLHTLFEQCAAQTPNLPALVAEDIQLSYAELDQKASLLAARLAAEGIAVGDYVHLFLPAGADLIVSLLAVLKIGAAYVPLEPTYPKQRLAFLCNDLDSRLILSHSDLVEQLPPLERNTLCVDQLDLSGLAPFTSTKTDPDACCMVLYTSGSTGNPKGVRLHHGGIANILLWEKAEWDIPAGEVVLQHASISFDFAQWEIFTALINSGCLVLTRAEFSYEGNYLVDLIQRHRITIMGSVPSLLALLISLPDFARCTSLKRVVAGGEILNADFQARFFKCSQAELINIYGPTETSISVLQWRCQRKADSSRVPIGFPVAGMSIHLLDENMKPVGKGEKGEICIAGAGVAHGYHARETLTQERFIDSPEGQRLYRTGDLARQRADGAYEYLGRLDNQVKIRGQRVEPEEVEHVLRQCPSIEDGVVAARQSPTGAIELVAWYRAKTGADPDSSEIRRCMETILPAHMIPALFVPLAQLPLNPNGKIDRQALQVPAMAGATGNKLNKTQELVQSIWHEVLGYDVPGIDDNFFECGGNSLACLDLSVRIEKATGVRLSLSLLYEYSTIRVQAQRLDDCETADRIAYLSRETTGTNGTPLLLVSAIGGNLARVSGLGNYLTQYNVSAISSPVYASSPAIIADITDAQLATLQDNGLPEKIVLAGFSVGGLIAFELARKLTKKGVDVSQVILIDTATPVVIKKYLQQSGTFTGRLKALFRTVRERGINATIYLFLETLRKRRYASRLVKTYSPDIAEIMQTRKSQLLDVGIKAAMQYQPSSYDGDICLIRARDQIMFENDNASWGWKQHINGSLTCKNIAGSHSSLLREPNIRQVAAIIEHCL